MFSRRQVALFENDLTGQGVFFSAPREIITAWHAADFLPALERIETAKRDGLWAAGYLSYEAGYLLDPALAGFLPSKREAPLLCFGIFDGPADFHECNEPSDAAMMSASLSEPVATWDASKYHERFSILHDHLLAGDCYQGNLTFPVEAKWNGDALALYRHLRQRQPVRHAAFIDLDGPTVLSRSPELFFRVSRNRWIETLPMKGTAPRGKTQHEDNNLREFLRNDPKNQSENRMIVDLLRNDISRVSEVGTLHVPELFRVETYPTVHQMVSLVRARLIKETSFRDILTALFPCGSITGAPKISAMKILRGLEDTARNIYCGAIGWLAPDGQMDFNVAIRTVSLYENGRAVFNVGGGVVFDSTAEGEYAECLLKGRFVTGKEPISL